MIWYTGWLYKMEDKQTLTDQMVFDKVWNHFIVNKKPFGYDMALGECVYNREGLKCAVGINIPDELYERSLEGFCVEGILCSKHKYPKVCELFKEVGILPDLQLAHDSAAKLLITNKDAAYENFAEQLMKIATNYGLEVPK